jgi:hypothetical protein
MHQALNTNPTIHSEATRSCALCQKPLTDAASIEAGVGPICRSRSNEALARTFPARWREAFRMMQIGREKGLLVCALSGVQPTLTALADAVLMDVDAHARSDWRVVIKQAEWILSHDHIGGRLRCLLHDLAELLGYTATAALWRGEVVIGKATLHLEQGQLVLRSPRPNPEVRERLHACGWRFDRTKTAWTRRVATMEDVSDAEQILKTHFLSLDAEEGLLGARQHLQTRPSVPAPAQLWELRGDRIALKTPYNKAFVDALKAAVPARERVWVAASREWLVSQNFSEAVQQLVSAHFAQR